MKTTVTGEITAVKITADRNTVGYKITIAGVEYSITSSGLIRILKGIEDGYPNTDAITFLVGKTVTITLNTTSQVETVTV